MATQPTPQPPVVPPAGDPNAQYGPAPAEQTRPYQQQPVNQQYFAQPQAAPVQYVVMAESLKGVRGWLLFFTICFGIAGISYAGAFFAAMEEADIATLLFTPILAALAITTTVMIAMEKKLGRWLAIATYVATAIYSIVTTIIGSLDKGESAAIMMSSIIGGVIGTGLFSLYFVVSKRVKETLIK